MRNLLMMPVEEGNAGGGGTPKEQVVVTVDNKPIKVEVGKSDGTKAAWTFAEEMPEDAYKPEFTAKISKELQQTYKKSQNSKQELEAERQKLEKEKATGGNNSELSAKIDRLEALISGIKIGAGQNDNQGKPENRNSQQVFDSESELLKAAGVTTWEELDDLSQAQIVRAQEKVRTKERKYLENLSKAQQKDYNERLLLGQAEAKGYKSEDYKSWAFNAGVPITEKTLNLFLQLKEATKPKDTPDELDRTNQIATIRNNAPSQDITDGGIPNYEFVKPEKAAYKQHISGLKNIIEKQNTGNTISRLSGK